MAKAVITAEMVLRHAMKGSLNRRPIAALPWTRRRRSGLGKALGGGHEFGLGCGHLRNSGVLRQQVDVTILGGAVRECPQEEVGGGLINEGAPVARGRPL